MPILDLAGAKRLEGYKPRRRTMGDPGTFPAGLLGAGGNGGYAAAKLSRLTQDFIGANRSADADLYSGGRRLRARARSLAVDEPFARKFLQMVQQNVVGEAGILVKSAVTNAYGAETAETRRINERIDEEWNRWCKRGRCTADGKYSFADLQRLVIGNMAREGENLLKKVYGRQFNESAFALQLLDNDQLDDQLMMRSQDGAEIRMGVEVDAYGKPVAYWLYDGHPNDMLAGNRTRKRIAADDIIHSAVWDRPGQTRGVTWMAASMLSLNQYNRYEEAVVVKARSAAAMMATIEQDYPTDGFTLDGDDDDEKMGTDSVSGDYMSANAGEIPKLDMGQHLNWQDISFPTNTHKDFTQTMLRRIASGFLVMYPSLANDLEGVNFSSIRAGLLEERDMWRIVQRGLIETLIIPVRMAWIRMALLTCLQDVVLSPGQQEQFTTRGRGWAWVDPQKDAAATILELGEGLSTYEIKCAEKGLDWQEVAQQRKKEQDCFASMGVVYGVDITGDQGGKGVAAGDEDEAAKATGGSGSTKNA